MYIQIDLELNRVFVIVKKNDAQLHSTGTENYKFLK